MRPPEERSSVLALAEEGLTASAIARRARIPRSTVRGWLANPDSERAFPSWAADELDREGREKYSYLLGVYLGDGYVVRVQRTYRLRIYLDAKYPGIIDEVANAVRRIAPHRGASQWRSSQAAMVVVYACSLQWPIIFPQHGPGRKHERTIELMDWQDEIVRESPGAFLRGLIHTDGCRSLNTVRSAKRTYSYPRYLFSNRSEQILMLFAHTCDHIGVHWTRMNDHVISVARRSDVARLDSFIGPKR